MSVKAAGEFVTTPHLGEVQEQLLYRKSCKLSAMDARQPEEVRIARLFGVTFLLGAAWLATTFILHQLLLRILDLPGDSGYRDQTEMLMGAYLLPFIFGLPLWVTAALWSIESCWQHGLVARARFSYCGLSLALVLWCCWSLRVNLLSDHGNIFPGYGIPSNTVQAAAYAASAFPLALALGCLLIAIARRAPVGTAPSVTLHDFLNVLLVFS